VKFASLFCVADTGIRHQQEIEPSDFAGSVKYGFSAEKAVTGAVLPQAPEAKMI
jgi:hypothetical protein